MRNLILSCTALALILGGTAVRADDAAKKVIDAAIKAQGGAEAIAKYKDKAVTTKGKIKLFAPIEAEGPFETTAADGKFRREFQFSFMGTDIKTNVVFDGKTMWAANNGMIAKTFDKPEEIEAIKEAMYSEKMAGLALVGDKSVEMTLIGDDKVGDTPVVGVRITSKGHKDASVYFDKKTFLVKRVVGRQMDVESGTEVEQDRIVEEYKEFDGIKRPSRATILKDGKKQMEIEISEMKFIDKPDDSLFNKPE